MKKLIFIFSILSICYSYSQVLGSLDLENGEKIVMFKQIESLSKNTNDVDFIMNNESIIYKDKKGKSKSIKQAEVQKINYNNIRFVKLPICISNIKGHHKIIAENDNYLLTNFFQDGWRFYIFEKNKKKEFEKLVYHSIKKKTDLENLELIKKYFPKCDKLLVKIAFNIQKFAYKRRVRTKSNYNDPVIFDGISNLKCN
jgi:ribosomal protein L33